MRQISIIPFLFFSIALPAQLIYEVTPLDLGVSIADYSPVPMEGGFVMNSIREATGAIDYKDARTGKPLSDLYWVPLVKGIPGDPVLYSAALTTPINEGPADFSRNGTLICYTRNLAVPKNLSKLNSANGQLGLFFSELIDDKWQQPIPFQYNTGDHAIMHPAFSTDGNTLYFTSDMPGGYGGFDIYSCSRTNIGWSAPVNIGAPINSAANEVFPRVQSDGGLFFSSDRIGGMGKLDVYASDLNGDQWNEPVALPAPVNSPANDVGFTWTGTMNSALMSSDRSGNDQILMVSLTIEKFSDCQPQQRNNFCYAFNGRKHAATNNLPLEQVWDLGDGTRISGYSANHCYEKAGTYQVRSLLIDKKSGSIFHELSSNELVVEEFVQAFIAAPDTVRTGRQLALDPTQSNLPEWNAAEYHWDLGDGSRERTPRVIHQYNTAGEYLVKLDILSVPDNSGKINHQCNTKKIIVIDRFREHEDLTVVAQYQDAAGISHEFEFQELPFDEMSMAFDENSDVLFSVQLFASKERVDLEDPRFMEIRKHYRIIERYDPEKAVYTYSVGETSDLEELYEIFQKVRELQFLGSEVFMLEEETLIDMSQLEIASLEELRNTKLRTSSIHFQFNSAELGNGAQDVISEILDLLRQHPQLHVVIEAHTDDIGTQRTNLQLSQQRAASVVDHLIANGIQRDRMVAIGHGENQPIAPNKSEAERMRNRRVEFRMVVNEEIRPTVEIRR